LSYYSSAVALNSEGDTSIREDTLEGLGRLPQFLNILFGAIFKIAAPTPPSLSTKPQQSTSAVDDPTTSQGVDDKMFEFHHAHFIEATRDTDLEESRLPSANPDQSAMDKKGISEHVATKKFWLIEILPDPGYFVAGGVAGAFSRTSTAPLDRLKVYLIAHVDTAKGSIAAATRGDAKVAARGFGKPLVDACRELWKAGGMRSLFAGRLHTPKIRSLTDVSRQWSQCLESNARVCN
jgi:solute carrier family 25 phosphate transporter 23/24/25/41